MGKKQKLNFKRVTVVHLDNIILFPPVIQLVENLLSNYHYVYLVTSHVSELPEINRAYIQKTWWNLEKMPYVLPNKPYRLEPGEISQDMYKTLEIIKNEKRKVILFLGLFSQDRRLDEYAEAVAEKGSEYCLYIVGKPLENYKKDFARLLERYPSVQYLGYYPAPKHLAFLKYAYIGLLPYIPARTTTFRSTLNALYCAPNKMYAGYGVPMIGTDVMGLRLPFEQNGIGVCCRHLTVDSILEAIGEIEKNYDAMSVNCKKFYDSVDMDDIVEKILYEEE